MEIFFVISIGIGLLLIGVLFLVFSLSWMRKDEVSHRLVTYVGADDGKPSDLETSLMARRQELRGSFFERTLNPLLRRMTGLFGNLLPARRMAKGIRFGVRVRCHRLCE